MRPLSRTLVLAAAVLAVACSPDPRSDPAPLDRFAYPTSLAVSGGDLLVVSSNFDLAYANADGGSVIPVALTEPPAVLPTGLRIGSFGGELALVDPASCPAAGAAAQALVTSRLQDQLYRVGLAGNALSCGDGCVIGFGDDQRLGDPYGIGLTCPSGGAARAWVSFLRTPLNEGWIAAIDLANPSSRTVVSMGTGNIRSFAYDVETDRLFMTGVNTGLAAPLRWIELGGGCDLTKVESEGGCPFRGFDLWPLLRGAELSGIALSNPLPGLPRRIYLSVRVFDPDIAAAIGGRPGYDVTGELVVLEMTEGPTGDLVPQIVGKPLDIGLGASEVRVLPRRPDASGQPQRDLVAVTATEDGLLWIYDDQTGQMRDVFGRDPRSGAPGVGNAPFGLAVQDLRATPGTGDGTARVYVSSFRDNFVTAVDVPLSGAAPADYVRTGTGAGAPVRRIGVTP